MKAIDKINNVTRLEWSTFDDGFSTVIYGGSEDSTFDFFVTSDGDSWHCSWTFPSGDCGESTKEFRSPEDACKEIEDLFFSEIDEHFEWKKNRVSHADIEKFCDENNID